MGQLLGQISDVLSVTYAICPRISQKKIDHIVHSQFSVFSSLRGGSPPTRPRPSSGLAPWQCGRACPTEERTPTLLEAACRRQTLCRVLRTLRNIRNPSDGRARWRFLQHVGIYDPRTPTELQCGKPQKRSSNKVCNGRKQPRIHESYFKT